MLLGLDISTSIIGWSIFNFAGDLIDYGHIDLPKKEDLFGRLKFAIENIKGVLQTYPVENFAVEEAAKKFTAGKSSADTIFKLGAINFGLSFFLYERLGVVPVYVAATSARKLNGIKIKRGENSKEIVRRFVGTLYPKIVWDKKKTGTYKDYCFDMADAIIIGRAAHILNAKKPN